MFGLLSPWALTAIIAGVIASCASARSLQIRQGVEVIALTFDAIELSDALREDQRRLLDSFLRRDAEGSP